MKKIFTLSGVALLSLAVHAQTSHTDNFDGYTAGQALGPQATEWTTWSGAEGGSEDVVIVTNDANSAPNSLYFSSTSATGGPSDVVAYFGGQHNTGTFTYEQDMKLDASKGAYFNFQANTTIGQLWALEVYINQTGQFQMSNTNGVLLTGTVPTGAWFNLKFDINLNQNNWNVLVNNVSAGSFSNTVNQIASIDIFPVNAAQPIGGNNNAGFWVDNVSWTHTPYVLPTINAGVTAIGVMNPATRTPGGISGIVGQTRALSATVRNLGMTAITSFDIAMLYNSIPQNQTVSSVNIPSLGVYHVTFNVPVTFITGTNPVVVTVSNVNGAGPDGDLLDDMNTANATITTVPAPGKVVLGEEGTGTWCQWCPRGAIYMDYMAESYDGFWAGVAVHNGDPMVHTAYDAGMGALISGYPSGLVDRGPEADPSTFESEFLARVTVAPHAVIVNGAQYNTAGDTLRVSLTYTFAIAGSNQYKVACVLTEDSVTGTSGYNQSNAYANNAAGPMGGFESLPSSVPANQMNYNHVARSISPSFGGYAGFPSSVPVASVHTFTFAFAVPAGWDTSMLHIVGMLIDPAGDVDNASSTSVAEAITNGYTNGVGVGLVETPAQPDAMDVYPNPSTGMAFASVNLATSQEVIMTIRDVTGKIVAQRNYGELSGAQVLPINTSEFAQGMYTVELQTGDTQRVSQLIVQ